MSGLQLLVTVGTAGARWTGTSRWLAGTLIAVAVAAVALASPGAKAASPPSAAAGAGATVVFGDFNADGRADLALTHATVWPAVPVAFSNGDGTVNLTDKPAVRFAQLASVPGVKAVTGDFNHDGRTDIALTGISGWSTLPVAFSNGDGSFRITNTPAQNFATLAQASGAKAISGDFDHDGQTDIALTASTGWSIVPVAFSKGDGTFTITNAPVGAFGGWASAGPGVTVIGGDFNHDGRTDLALTPGPGMPWSTQPVAFSNGDGTFNVTNTSSATFAGLAQVPGARAIAGDFNHDGRTDIALTGANGWTTLPVAFSNGDGTFTVTNTAAGGFAGWASASFAVGVISADFNGDGRTDLALTPGANMGWSTQPIAFSHGDGTFTISNAPAQTLAAWVQGAANHPNPAMVAPALNPPQASGASASLTWTDRSGNEDTFEVFRRDPANGSLIHIHAAPSTSRAGTGQTYSFADTIPAGSRQCYEIGTYNYQGTGVNVSNEVCTRPPPPCPPLRPLASGSYRPPIPVVCRAYAPPSPSAVTAGGL